MVESGVSFEDELILAMQGELESALAEEKSDTVTADHEKRKKAMMSILAASVRTQRLYFVVRSAIISLLSALITFIIVGYLGSINAVEAVFLGLFVFIAALVVSRLLDKPIVMVSKKTINMLNKHKRARGFVLKHL